MFNSFHIFFAVYTVHDPVLEPQSKPLEIDVLLYMYALEYAFIYFIKNMHLFVRKSWKFLPFSRRIFNYWL